MNSSQLNDSTPYLIIYNQHNLITAHPTVIMLDRNETKCDDIVCYYTNVQSIVNKYDEMLTTVIEEKKPMIIGLTESWCHNDIEDREIAIDGYTLFRKDRLVGIGGGVLLYVSEDLRAESVPVLNSHDFEDSNLV